MLDLLRTRRSIRVFENRPVDPGLVAQLKEAVLRSPSSRSLNPWQFLFIENRSLLATLSGCKPHGAGFLKKAPMGIVVCADPSVCDVWVEDSSIASIILHLTAHSLGLGSCWIQIRKRMFDAETSSCDFVKKTLDLPEHLEIESIIAAGYPAENPPAHTDDHLLWDRVTMQ
ncbi:nitroreductase family protein [Desulfoplanes sp.]